MAVWKYNLRGNALLEAITATTCQAFLLLGYDQGAMSGIIGANNAFGRDFNHPDPDMLGNITAIFDIGCVSGSLLCYFIGERLGRRKLLMLGGTVMFFGAAILASSDTIAQLIVGRIVVGLGTGINSSTAPTFLSECAPAGIRGGLLTLQGTVTNVGVVIAFWTAYATSSYGSSFQWRFPLAFQAVFAVLLILQTIGLPESPPSLASQRTTNRSRTPSSTSRKLWERSVAGDLSASKSSSPGARPKTSAVLSLPSQSSWVNSSRGQT